MNVSAGLLLFRRAADGIEVLLVHPGGPFWKNREAGAWSIPKGLVEEGEDLLDAAKREFHEETGLAPHGPYWPLSSIRQKQGKIVEAWACEGDADVRAIKSNLARIEMPRGSGRWIEIPEVDRAAWFSPEAAREKINPAQAELIDRLLVALQAM